MRKQTKLVAVLSAAALLAIGASMTSFAATPHWDQEDGEWIYLDRNGDKVTGEWKKSNGQWYYLDDDGYMAKDLLIEYNDDRYYVDENGVKVTNSWVSMDNDDYLDDDDVSTVWFYFDGKGKAVGYNDETIKSLNYGDGQKGYFIFNTDGVMLSGWQDFEYKSGSTARYYLGDENEGWAKTGWNYLDTDAEIFDEGDEDGNPYEDEEWFWFDSKGKAKQNGTKEIGGKWYAFNEDGVMLDLWVYASPASPANYVAGDDVNSSASSSSADGKVESKAAYYREDNGGREKNWIFAYASNGEDEYDDDMYWFYLDSKGKPTLAVDGDNAVKDNATDYSDDAKGNTERTVVAKSIKNKIYIFDDGGRARTGLFKLDSVQKGANTNALDGYYYFQEDDDHGSTEGQMVTNKKVTIDIDNEDVTYYFKKDGTAYTNAIVSGSLYGANGKLVDGFGDGSTYEAVEIFTKKDDLDETYIIDKGEGIKEKTKKLDIPVDSRTMVLLNGNGKIKKTGTVTINGDKYTVSNYVVTKIEDENKKVIFEASVKDGVLVVKD